MNPAITPAGWRRLSEAIDFYVGRGYTYIEVPWIVSPNATGATIPEGEGRKATSLADGRHLVGSAEQGFVQMMMDGKLPAGKYVTLTPCFRDEPEITALHRPHFMKVELIYIPADGDQLYHLDEDAITQDARDFFVRCGLGVWRHDDSQGIDLMCYRLAPSMELGSYGIRTHGSFRWVYGTGCAEPRTSQVLRRQQLANGWDPHDAQMIRQWYESLTEDEIHEGWANRPVSSQITDSDVVMDAIRRNPKLFPSAHEIGKHRFPLDFLMEIRERLHEEPYELAVVDAAIEQHGVLGLLGLGEEG